MSRLSTPIPELATGAAAGISSQIKTAVGNVPTRAALALAALLIATASAADPADPITASGSSRADRATAERVYSALDHDPVYFYQHINVRVDDGVAHLSGHVLGTESLYHAQRVARHVSGVKAVVSELHLEREEGLSDGG
jgi:osmotically-inducible protein OsmY